MGMFGELQYILANLEQNLKKFCKYKKNEILWVFKMKINYKLKIFNIWKILKNI